MTKFVILSVVRGQRVAMVEVPRSNKRLRDLAYEMLNRYLDETERLT